MRLGTYLTTSLKIAMIISRGIPMKFLFTILILTQSLAFATEIDVGPNLTKLTPEQRKVYDLTKEAIETRKVSIKNMDSIQDSITDVTLSNGTLVRYRGEMVFFKMPKAPELGWVTVDQLDSAPLQHLLIDELNRSRLRREEAKQRYLNKQKEDILKSFSELSSPQENY